MAKEKRRKLGKLGIAILEGFLEKKLGTAFVEEIRKGHQEHDALIEAFAHTEERFRDEFPDKAVTKSIFDDLSLEGLPSLREACHAFYLRPSSSELPIALRGLFTSDFGDSSFETINQVIATYLAIFRDELAQQDERFRENARALSDFSSEESLKQIHAILQKRDQLADASQHAIKIQSLHQLRPAPADFTGRETELQQILHAVKKDGAVISSLRGQGGIGKTVLALKVAHVLINDYPDAQILLDLQGNKKGAALSTNQAMAYVIHSFEPEAQLPEQEAELRSLYLSVLHGKRALLLMDNASNATQVKPLIPPDSCLILITSRQHFTLDGFHSLNLNQMQPVEAENLLLRIAPRIGDFAAEIADLCGCLPLALRVSAETIKERRDIGVQDYIEKLQNERTQLEIVEASLSASYELQSEELQSYWRRLAIFPTTFTATATAAIWETEEDKTKDLLWELQKFSLIEWNEEEERYRLHDLARVFANSRLKSGELQKIGLLHSAYYMRILSLCDLLFLKGEEGILPGLQVFDAERGNIEAGQNWAANHIEGSDEAAELANQYPNAGVNILSLRLLSAERILWLNKAITAANKLGDKYAKLAHLGNLGNAHSILGQTREAIKYYERALEGSQEVGDRRGEGYATGSLGSIYADLGDTQKAIEYHKQALEIHREIGDRRAEGIATGNLGNAFYSLGEPRKAIGFYEEQLEITREIGDRRGEGAATGNLGNAFFSLGELHKAIELYEQRLEIAREIGDRLGEGAATGNLGSAYAAFGETRKAIDFYEQQLEIAREIGDRRSEGIATGNLGSAYARLGEARKAIKHYEHQLAIMHEIGNRRGEGIAMWNKAMVLRRLALSGEAIRFAEEALAIFEAIEAPEVKKARLTIQRWEAELASE